MITTITLNPAVDKTYTTAMLMPGQVNRMDSVKNIAGGKGINVARVLRQYGYTVSAMGFLGGYTGNFIETEIVRLQIRNNFTHITGETRTSMNVLAGDGYVTEILEPGPMIRDFEMDQFFDDFEQILHDGATIIMSGSVPRQVPVTIYGDLIRKANSVGCRVFLDTSGELLREGVKEHPFMIKPNLKELEALVDRRVRGLEECIEAAVEIQRMGVPHVLVSMGAKGMIYTNENEILYAKAPKLKTVNTVGSGDSAVAAFVMACMENLSGEDLLKQCVGISAANATTLENGQIPMEEAKVLISQVLVQRF